MNAQLPEYSFDQTMDSVVVSVKVTDVKVENISLGITHQQVGRCYQPKLMASFLSIDLPHFNFSWLP